MTTSVKRWYKILIKSMVTKSSLITAAVLCIALGGGWLRWQLAHTAETFRDEFERQNLSELASGDSLALVRKLEALSKSIPWSCIDGTRTGKPFYFKKRGSCTSGLFHEQVKLSVAGNTDLKIDVTMTLPLSTLCLTILLIASQLALLIFFNRTARIEERAEMMILLERERAQAMLNKGIAGMTQMLAHDVRKPFSLLKMGLGMLGSAKDPASVKKVLSRLVPEIDKAVSSVDGLIADVMEVGSSSTQLIQEPTSPESLIEATLGETFRICPKADIAIGYDLQHTHMVNVHVQKVNRVFSNIFGNAIQAMGQKGSTWFKTRDVTVDGLPFVECCLGNAGSVIPSESLPKLFEAFFTSGKKGGTGLGLAIAQKVVMAHGGRIWCESSTTEEHPKGKVEFFFTLPATTSKATPPKERLPTHSSQITQALLALAETSQAESSMDQGELELEASIVKASTALGRSLRVLIVDDEDVYRQALAASLARTPELSNKLVVRMAAGSEQALELATKAHYDLVITDVDMGPSSLCGFDLVERLRALPSNALICVHSNRVVAADHRTAIDAGADAFISKPASRSQVLKLVLQAAQMAAVSRQGASAKPSAQAKPEVLIVEDCIFTQEAWEQALSADAVVHTMTSLEDLGSRLETDPGFAARLLLAVTDLHLDGSAGDGLDVGRLLKKYRPDLRVLLSSDGVVTANELAGAIDRPIAKKPVGLAQLQAL